LTESGHSSGWFREKQPLSLGGKKGSELTAYDRALVTKSDGVNLLICWLVRTTNQYVMASKVTELISPVQFVVHRNKVSNSIFADS
jgi:hypothetical protein